MDLFDIFLAEQHWNNCADARPWLIVDFGANGLVGCFPIATQCYHGNCFPIEDSHPDFVATGLRHSCYILDSHVIDIPGDKFIKRWGSLQGKLLDEFRRYSGI